ncbi:MAG: hypothetical protein V3S12_04660 [Acidiferrobacterales bacterium]
MTATDKNEDRELKEYLAGDSDLSHAYRQMTNEEPSTTVDAAIRAAARREVKSGLRFITNPFGQQWTVPTSLAAMLLISIGLVVFMSDETGTDRFGPGVLDEDITQQKFDSSAGRAGGFADDKAPALAAPAADQQSEEKLSGKKTGASAADATVSKPMQPASKSKILKKSRARRMLEADPILPRQHQKPASVAPGAAEPMQRMEMEAPVAGAVETVLPPEQWLRQIQALRDQGKNKEADVSLAKFRKAYPDYPLDSLRQ